MNEDIEISEKTEKKHNTAKSSIESWKIINSDGTRASEKTKLFEAIVAHGPITSRYLSQITKIERSSVCRAIFDLRHEMMPQVKVAFMAKCPVTNRTVEYYSHVNWQPPQVKQGEFFNLQSQLS